MMLTRSVALALSLMLIGCLQAEQAGPSGARPSSVPVEAAWVGGADGGVYIQLLSVAEREIEAGIYAEHDGQPLFSGRLYSEAALRQPLGDVTGWDGDCIYFANQQMTCSRE
ncbi:MAG: hypothetical protein II007_06275 [Gammaproteobacteria bacterium]|nr:hypothetical protein [Gammaproteobacteria bacterium]